MEQTNQNTPMLLKVRDVQKMLNVGRDTVYSLIATGGIRSVQIGRNFRVPADAVEEYIRSLPSGSKADDSHAA